MKYDTKNSNDRANMWSDRFSRCEADQQRLFKKVSKFYDIMYAVQNTDNVAPWRAKIYVPIMASKAWDLISRLSDVLPYFRTRIANEIMIDEQGKFMVPPKTLARQRRIDNKLHYDYCYNSDEPMKLKVFDTMLDAVVGGTGFAKVGWEYAPKNSYSRQYDAEGLIQDMSKETKRITKKGRNTFEPINFFNVFIGDNATSFHKAKYVIVRYFKPIDELKAQPHLKNVDSLYGTPDKGDFDTYNQARNRLVNDNKTDNNDKTVPTATVYECFEHTPEGMKCATYGLGKGNKVWVELEAPVKKYWHDYMPIQPFYIRRKSFSPWGESLFENNSTLQYATNDLFNHYLDNWNLSIDSMIMYEDGSLTSDFLIEPGGEITYTGEKPDAFKFPEPNPAQLSMVMNVIDKAVEQATVPQYISGVPNSSTDKTAGTAKGISMITEAATEKIGYMRDNFKQSMLTVGRIWLSNLEQFQDVPEEIRMYERGEEKADIIMPEDYAGDKDLTIDDDSLVPMSKEQKSAALQALTSQAMMIQKAAIEQANITGTKDNIPIINYGEILDESVQYYAVKEPSRFVIKQQELAMNQPMSPKEQNQMMQLGGAPGQSLNEAAAQGQEGANFGTYS